MRITERIKSLSRFEKTVIGILLSIILYTLVGFFVVPPVVKSLLQKNLSKQLHRDVTVAKVYFNPYALSLAIRGLEVKESEAAERFAACEEIYVNVEFISLPVLAPIIKEIKIAGPILNIVRLEDGRYNFSDLLKAEEPEEQKKPSSLLRFTVRNIELSGGVLRFDDRPHGKKHEIQDIRLLVPFVSSMADYRDTWSTADLAAKINAGPLSVKARIKPFSKSLDAAVDADISSVDVPFYMPYLPVPANFSLRSGSLGVKAEIAYALGEGGQPSLEIKGNAGLRGFLAVDGSNADLAKFDSLMITVASLEPLKQRIHLSEVSLDTPDVAVILDEAGRLNWTTLFSPAADEGESQAQSEQKPPEEKPSEQKSPEQSSEDKPQERSEVQSEARLSQEPEEQRHDETRVQPQEKSEGLAQEQPAPGAVDSETGQTGPGFAILVDEVKSRGGNVRFADMSRPSPFKTTLSSIDFSIKDFSTAPDSRTSVELTAKTEAEESIKIKSDICIDPMSVEGELEVVGIVLGKYSPYYEGQVSLKRLGGYLDVSGKLRYVRAGQEDPSINLSGDIALRGVEAVGKDGEELLKFKALQVAIGDLDLPARRLRLSRVALDSPELKLSLDSAGRLNVAPVLAGEGKAPPPEKGSADPAPFSLDLEEANVSNGKVEFEDSSRGKSFRTTLTSVELSARNFSNRPNATTAVTVAARTESNEAIKITGNVSTDPLDARGNIELGNIAIRKYTPYYKDLISFDVREAILDVNTGYHFSQGGGAPQVKLSELSSELRNLKARIPDESEDFVNIPSIRVKGTQFDLAQKALTIGELSTSGGVVVGSRDGEGKLNFEKLTPAPSSEAGAQGEGNDGKTGENPWLITLKRGEVKDYTIKALDLAVGEPVALNLDRIALMLSNFSTAQKDRSSASLSFRFQESGQAKIEGDFSIKPLFADVAVNLDGIGITPLHAYLRDYINLRLDDGNVSVAGKLSLDATGEQGMKINYTGDASLESFAAVDMFQENEFIQWKALHFKGIDGGNVPARMHMEKALLVDVNTLLRINADGTVNVVRIFRDKGQRTEQPSKSVEGNAQTGSTDLQPPGTSSAPTAEEEAGRQAASSQATSIKIGVMELTGGRLNFSDYLIKPNFSADLLDLQGTVSGLSSEPGTQADVNLTGKLEGASPLEITGKISPLTDELFVDFNVSFANIDITRATPYAQKYIGYSLDKGNLLLDLKYQVVKKKLDAQNNIVFKGLTLGEKVDSPDATTLPVKFAISLLQDRSGELRLDIPVSGDIDSPKFDLGQTIAKAIRNLFTKAVTAPFALLGAMIGVKGGEELSYVEFDYGSSDLTSQGTQKIEALFKILFERPQLSLEMEGYVDERRDRDAIKEKGLDRMLREQKLKEQKKEVTEASLEQVEVKTEELVKYLRMAYAEKFPKEAEDRRALREVSGVEMKRELLATIQVKKDDLRELAKQRSINVKEEILKSGKVDAKRIFLAEPKSLEPGKEENLKKSRVNIALR